MTQRTLSKLSPPTWSWDLVITQVHKQYGGGPAARKALHDVTLSVPPGVFGLLGRNGAGKTTLLHILATLLQPTSGEVRFGPYNLLKDRQKVRRVLGFLPQEVGFFPSLTVKETLSYLGSLQHVEKLPRQIDAVLDIVNLRDAKKARVGTLSGGMKRRLGLAQALLSNPRLLIIDEPTAGLDLIEQQRFRTLLGTLGAQGEQTIILSTHIVADVATMAGRLAVLEKGHLLFQGTVRELALRSQGRSWLWRTTIEKVDDLRQRQDMIVTAVTPVVDAHAAVNEVVVRVEGTRPAPEAALAEPTLEDGYFSLIGGTSTDEDGVRRLANLRFSARR